MLPTTFIPNKEATRGQLTTENICIEQPVLASGKYRISPKCAIYSVFILIGAMDHLTFVHNIHYGCLELELGRFPLEIVLYFNSLYLVCPSWVYKNYVHSGK
jgi:hypothetical protein